MDIQQICRIIIEQLGGYNKLKAMTGLKQLVSDKENNSLTLIFPSRITKFNYVTIKLCQYDTYSIKFSKIAGIEIKKDIEFTDIYVDNLKNLVEKQTGMRLSLF